MIADLAAESASKGQERPLDIGLATSDKYAAEHGLNGQVVGHVQLMSYDPYVHDEYGCGWDGPGFYFWDETDGYCHGPFSTRDEARAAMSEYAKTL